MTRNDRARAFGYLALLLAACTDGPPSPGEQDASVMLPAPLVPSASSEVPVPPPAAIEAPDILLHYRDTVPPGVEDVKCIDVPGPAVDTWVTGWHVERRSGAHHAGVAIRRAGKPYTTPTRCSTDPAIDEGLLISTQPSLEFSLPDDAAILVPASSSFMVEVHELNSLPTPAEASVDFALHTTTSPEAIANLFVLIASGSSVPPASTRTLTTSCPAPRDLDVLAITSHSHAHSTLVTGTIDGAPAYSSTTWAEPAATVFDPPLHVKAGATFTWACTVANSTSKTLTNCTNRDTCEMCELIGWAVADETWTCRK